MYCPSLFFSFLLSNIFLAQHTLAAGKTHIYIDQIPLYTEIASCARDRLEAIVRNQFSGCGDDQQLTSFGCFCIDSSSEFSSIISTAVEQKCSRATAQATTKVVARARQTATPVMRRGVLRRQIIATPRAKAVANDLSGAMEVWESYCAKSTELVRFGPTTTEKPATVIITQPPQIVTVGPSNGSKNSEGTQIAAIVAPAIIIPIVGLCALYLYLRRRRLNRDQSHDVGQIRLGEVKNNKKNVKPFTELTNNDKILELECTGLAHELESPIAKMVELDGGAQR